jgi:hypothetical protein
MTNEKSQLEGYNKNKFANYEHVFEVGVGCWCFSKKEAIENSSFTGNEVNCYFLEKKLQGYKLYIQKNENVWD